MKKVTNDINDIRTLMYANDLESVDFLNRKDKPVIQKDGIKYEILTIFCPDEDDESVTVTAIPNYSFCLKHLDVDSTWRRTTWDKLVRIVESEITRMQEE